MLCLCCSTGVVEISANHQIVVLYLNLDTVDEQMSKEMLNIDNDDGMLLLEQRMWIQNKISKPSYEDAEPLLYFLTSMQQLWLVEQEQWENTTSRIKVSHFWTNSQSQILPTVF